MFVFGAGVASLYVGKAYSKHNADKIYAESYRGATTRDDITNAINTHNDPSQGSTPD
jgi:hypothetical protein